MVLGDESFVGDPLQSPDLGQSDLDLDHPRQRREAVVQNRDPDRGLDPLLQPDDLEAAGPFHRAALGFEFPGDHLEQRGLSTAVATEQDQLLTRIVLEGGPAKHAPTGKRDAHVVQPVQQVMRRPRAW